MAAAGAPREAARGDAKSAWNIAEGNMEDPEEERVILCALDSFA